MIRKLINLSRSSYEYADCNLCDTNHSGIHSHPQYSKYELGTAQETFQKTLPALTSLVLLSLYLFHPDSMYRHPFRRPLPPRPGACVALSSITGKRQDLRSSHPSDTSNSLPLIQALSLPPTPDIR